MWLRETEVSNVEGPKMWRPTRFDCYLRSPLAFFEMAFRVTSCRTPTAIPWLEGLWTDAEEEGGVAEEELEGPGLGGKERKGWPWPVGGSTRFHRSGSM